jgi:hypothetical protein
VGCGGGVGDRGDASTGGKRGDWDRGDVGGGGGLSVSVPAGIAIDGKREDGFYR